MSALPKAAGQLEAILFDLGKESLGMPLSDMVDTHEAMGHLRKAHVALLRIERNRRLSAQTPKPALKAPKA